MFSMIPSSTPAARGHWVRDDRGALRLRWTDVTL